MVATKDYTTQHPGTRGRQQLRRSTDFRLYNSAYWEPEVALVSPATPGETKVAQGKAFKIHSGSCPKLKTVAMVAGLNAYALREEQNG